MADRHTYILRLPPPLRESLAREAAESKRSLNELITQALCDYLGMKCPETTRGRRSINGTAENIPLRVSEELFAQILLESQLTERSMRQFIVDVLEKKYKVKV